MIRKTFEQELLRLQQDVMSLASMVEYAIADSVEILKRRDEQGARRMIARDSDVNRKCFAIQSEALLLIAKQQPVAGDLRTLGAILEIARELERVGDYAKGIAKISLMVGDEPLIKPLVDIPLMADRACDMLRRSLDAFIQRDVEEARLIPLDDDEVDALYNQVYRELLAIMMSNPRTIDQASYLLWVAHNLERTADRVTNICEQVIFTVTGSMMEMDADEELGTRHEALS